MYKAAKVVAALKVDEFTERLVTRRSIAPTHWAVPYCLG